MSEWWTYRLSDFLMFSPAVYWRLVERYNRETWPLPLVALAAGAVLLWLAVVRRPGAARVAAALLAVAWAWTGWAFHAERYAPINWAAAWFAWAFALQALLLAVAALLPPRAIAIGKSTRAWGLGLATAGVALYPFAGLAFGRPLAQAETFGLMPDPTALATLGLVLALPLPLRRVLRVIPLLSLAAGSLTLLMMAG